MTTQERLTVYADGSCIGNPGPGGWGAWIDSDRWAAASAPNTTNNRMELTAVLEILRSLDGPLLIVCDSKYVIDSVTKWRHSWKKRGWKKADGSPLANCDLMIEIDSAMRDNVEFRWVKGHSGHVGNEAADTAARDAAMALRDGAEASRGPGLNLR